MTAIARWTGHRPAVVDDLVQAALTTRVVEIDGYRVLVTATICSVLGDTWAWVWGASTPTPEGEYTPIVPHVQNWSDEAEVRGIARQVLDAFLAA